MTVMYATVTSKGQVTLPVQLRRMLNITPGQTVGFRADGDTVTLEAAASVEEIRAMLERSARRNGTWGQADTAESWPTAAVQRYARS